MLDRITQPIRGVDYWFLISFLLLVAMGAAILQTASISDPQEILDGGNIYDDFLSQLYKGILPGLGVFFLIQLLPYHIWRKGSLFLYVLALILNLLVLIPALGASELGATRWIEFGSLSFQPSELLKLTLILYLSALLAQHRDTINMPSSAILFFITISLPVVIVAGVQSNISTAGLIAAIGGMLLLVSRFHLAWLAVFGMVGLVFAAVLIFVADYRIDRISTFTNVWTTQFYEQCESYSERRDSYHTCQNLIAVGSGGLTGVGVGQGVQKFNYVPKATNDSIFAVYAEETGLIGVSLFLLLVLWILYRCVIIAGRHRSDDFARLVIFGIMSWFILQTFLNIGSTIAILPVTGVTLPFVSQGGTSLIVLFIAFGIIAGISRSAPDTPSRR